MQGLDTDHQTHLINSSGEAALKQVAKNRATVASEWVKFPFFLPGTP